MVQDMQRGTHICIHLIIHQFVKYIYIYIYIIYCFFSVTTFYVFRSLKYHCIYVDGSIYTSITVAIFNISISVYIYIYIDIGLKYGDPYM